MQKSTREGRVKSAQNTVKLIDRRNVSGGDEKKQTKNGGMKERKGVGMTKGWNGSGEDKNGD